MEFPVVSAGRTPVWKRPGRRVLANSKANCTWRFGISGIRLRYGTGTAPMGVPAGYEDYGDGLRGIVDW